MENKAVMNGSPFHKGYGVLQWLMHDFSNRLLLAYCCLGILLFPLYQYQINPDDVSYINIAHLYAIGNFHDAINGYWGPLISWLSVPLLLAKFQPLLAYQTLSLIIGFFTLIAIRKLSYRFALNERVRLLILLAAMPLLLSYTFFAVPPDLLFLCISLYYFYYIFDADYSKKAASGFIVGLLGALLFFSKGYGFYFFLAHFSLFTVIYYVKSKTQQERRSVLLNYIFGLTIFLILSGIWIYSLSEKYQHFTISSSGEYNMQLDDSLGSQGQPMHSQGLLPLPYSAAVSAWDDPSYLTIDYDKSPRLLDWITFQIVHIGGNVVRTVYYFELFSIFSMGIVSIYALRSFGKRFRRAEEGHQSPEGGSWSRQLLDDRSRDDGKLHSSPLYALITMLVYTAGYELLHIEPRFLWVDAILLLLLCAGYIGNNPLDFMRSARLRRVLFYLVFLSFWLYPVMQLIIHVNQNRDIYLTAQQLQTGYHLKGNLASNDNGGDGWDLTLFYTYFLESKYYGATQKQITDEDLQSELGKYHIDYYFAWNSVCRLAECRKIAEFDVEFLWTSETKHLIVYQIKKR